MSADCTTEKKYRTVNIIQSNRKAPGKMKPQAMEASSGLIAYSVFNAKVTMAIGSGLSGPGLLTFWEKKGYNSG